MGQKVKRRQRAHSAGLGRQTFLLHLICFGEGPLNDLNILLTEEATGQQVVQDALSAPQRGHQQLSVVGEDVEAGGFFHLIHVYVTSVGQAQAKSPWSELLK